MGTIAWWEMKTSFDKLLLDDSPDAVMATTPEGAILYWSKEAETVFGYAVKEVLGGNMFSLIVPPDRVEEERKFRSDTAAGGFAVYESLRRRKDGSLLYVDVSSKALLNEKHGVEGILSSNKDVTHLRSQRDAKLIGARFRDLLESVPDGIVVVNATGRIVHANTQAETLFGYEHGKLLGEKIEMLLPERFRNRHVGHRADYAAHPRVRAMGAGLDLFGRRNDNTEFPVEISLSPIKIEEGTFVMSAIRDITDRKRFERALQEKNAELEIANRELESFSYSVSHDLRSPVRAMSGFARMVHQEHAKLLPPEAQKQLQRVYENAAKMGELIDGLLIFSRLSRQPVRKTTVQPTKLVNRVLEELRAEQASRRIEIKVADLPPCEADLTLLQQVYANLLSNAFKYTRDRDPAVIEVGFRPKNGECVYYIKDNGAGFEMQYAGKLFGVFQRLHGAHQFEGTGVGLAIAQRIVNRHGGKIWAEAEPDKGATFFFTLGNGQVYE
jgi:PAS domain S-box-containing protein